MNSSPSSLIAAVRYFSDRTVCNDYMRSIKGTYVSVAPFHLQRYVDEQAFRFNTSKGVDSDRFASVMQTTIGRRLTWRRLCEVDGCGFMGLQ